MDDVQRSHRLRLQRRTEVHDSSVPPAVAIWDQDAALLWGCGLGGAGDWHTAVDRVAEAQRGETLAAMEVFNWAGGRLDGGL